MVVGDDIAVGGNEEARSLRLRQVMGTPQGRAFAVVLVRHAELLEKAVERAARGKMMRGGRVGLVIGLAAVGELDLHRNDGILNFVDDIGE